MMHSTPILLYHKIGPPIAEDGFRLSVSPQKFEQQMSYLYDQEYRCVSLEELWQYKRNKRSLPKNSFAITFDDGYADNYEVAYPILSRYGFTATIFTVTDFVGRSIPWPDKNGSQFMNWSQIKEMADNGFTFGGHTQTHPNLTEIPSTQISQEVKTPKAILEEQLGQPAHFFAYPGGHQTEGIQKIVRDAGYKIGLGVDIGPANLFNLWRVQLNTDDGLMLFRLKVSGWFERLKQLRQQSKALWWATELSGRALNRVRS